MHRMLESGGGARARNWRNGNDQSGNTRRFDYKADAKERTAGKDSVMEQKTGKMIYASERAVELLSESAFSFAVNILLVISPSAFDY
ncbi:hypothetical protein QE152_g12672 [Popillia japonica]|uniref:Uncharacterized protein n=1 Tax=Popillia japonica TaxID=7064 RepID=A0AAW1LS84_POPJA